MLAGIYSMHCTYIRKVWKVLRGKFKDVKVVKPATLELASHVAALNIIHFAWAHCHFLRWQVNRDFSSISSNLCSPLTNVIILIYWTYILTVQSLCFTKSLTFCHLHNPQGSDAFILFLLISQ